MDVPDLRLAYRVYMKMWLETLTGTYEHATYCTYMCKCLYDLPIKHVHISFSYFIRGHTVNAVCESFQGAKDAGFKVKRQNGMYVYVCLHNFQVVAHMMPDLPNVGLERDIEQFIVSN